MALLFVDNLDLWLMLLGTSLLVVAAWVYLNFYARRPEQELIRANRGLGIFFTAVGAYALATGLWGTFTWPLPGPYNIVLINPWGLYGLALLLLGASSITGAGLHGLALGVPALSLPVLVYGALIYTNNLTREPLMASLMYILIALAGLLSPLLLLTKRRGFAIVVMGLIAIAALIALATGIGAASSHIAGWSKWVPWYGKLIISE